MIKASNSGLHKDRKSVREGINEGKIRYFCLFDLTDNKQFTIITAAMYSVIIPYE